jgi:hypothetical protein
MASKSVEYLPAPGDSPVTIAFGREFRQGKPVDIDDENILRKLTGHPRFSVDGDKKKRGPGRPPKEAPPSSPARAAGAQAAREAKPRQAPGELDDDETMDWLAGYDTEKLAASSAAGGRSAASLGAPTVNDPDAVERAREQKAAIDAASKARATETDPAHPGTSHGDDD